MRWFTVKCMNDFCDILVLMRLTEVWWSHGHIEFNICHNSTVNKAVTGSLPAETAACGLLLLLWPESDFAAMCSLLICFHSLKSQAAPCCGQDFLCRYWCEHSFFKHRALSVSLCQNTPTEAKKGKKPPDPRPRHKSSLRLFPFYMHVSLSCRQQNRPFFWWSRTWCHTACISGTGRPSRGKTGCYTTRWAGKSQHEQQQTVVYNWF